MDVQEYQEEEIGTYLNFSFCRQWLSILIQTRSYLYCLLETCPYQSVPVRGPSHSGITSRHCSLLCCWSACVRL